MKSLVVLISLSQLLILVAFSSCTTLGTSPGSDSPDVVIDAVYADVRYDKKYFIVHSLLESGGVTRGLNGGLVPTPDPSDFALSVVFKPKKSNTQELVTEDTPLNIVFYKSSLIAGDVWKVEGFPGTSPPFLLSSNGVEGNPLDVTSWFQIKKVNYFSYKLVFCPWQSTCRDVGFEVVNGERRLAVNTTNVFTIVFAEDADLGGRLPVVLNSVNGLLTTNRSYFVVHSFSTLGGGVSGVGARNRLVQSADEVEFGMSVVFKPKKKQKQVEISESTPLNVVFNTPLQGTGSNNGTVWKVEGLSGSSPYFLSSNGVERQKDSIFRIKRVNYFSYSLVFCRSQKFSSCSNVALMFVDGERRLALTTSGSTILPLLFVKAPPRVIAMDAYHFDLRFDRRYFVVSTAFGGVIRGPNNELVQAPDPVDYGMSVVFKPVDPNSQDELILESTPLNLVFVGGKAWKVEGFPGTAPYFLSSNGVAGNPSDMSTWFQIKKASYFSFKLVFCSTKDTCSDVSLQVVDGVKRLVLETGNTNSLVFILDETSVPGKSSI